MLSIKNMLVIKLPSRVPRLLFWVTRSVRKPYYKMIISTILNTFNSWVLAKATYFVLTKTSARRNASPSGTLGGSPELTKVNNSESLVVLHFLKIFTTPTRSVNLCRKTTQKSHALPKYCSCLPLTSFLLLPLPV